MSKKPVWANQIEEAAWRERWCRTCFQPDEALRRVSGEGAGCPLLALAATGRLPGHWQRQRNNRLGDTYRCNAYVSKPAVNRRGVSTEESLPLFDEPTRTYTALVPVEGWPDWRTEGRKEGTDHQ